MKCLLLSLALLELLLWHKGSALFLNEDCERIDEEDGATTAPWMAAVSNEQGFLCGGSLITKKFVLTAAHCIKDQEKLFVKLGVLDRSDAYGMDFNVSRIIMHGDYQTNPGVNDIGLLKLASEVDYTDRIRPICILMDAASVLQNINRFSAFGWGKTETGNLSQNLKTIQLRRLPSDKCQHDNMPQLTNTQFCADSETGDGPCIGDGGGPLTSIVRNRTVQVGIVSYGPRDCNLSAVYTDVASYTGWIASNVHKA